MKERCIEVVFRVKPEYDKLMELAYYIQSLCIDEGKVLELRNYNQNCAIEACNFESGLVEKCRFIEKFNGSEKQLDIILKKFKGTFYEDEEGADNDVDKYHEFGFDSLFYMMFGVSNLSVSKNNNHYYMSYSKEITDGSDFKCNYIGLKYLCKNSWKVRTNFGKIIGTFSDANFKIEYFKFFNKYDVSTPKPIATKRKEIDKQEFNKFLGGEVILTDFKKMKQWTFTLELRQEIVYSMDLAKEIEDILLENGEYTLKEIIRSRFERLCRIISPVDVLDELVFKADVFIKENKKDNKKLAAIVKRVYGEMADHLENSMYQSMNDMDIDIQSEGNMYKFILSARFIDDNEMTNLIKLFAKQLQPIGSKEPEIIREELN